MTAPRRTASPHAKAVERIVEWSLAEGDYRDALRARILRLVARVERSERERCIRACDEAVPPAHTYASENADIYRAGDAARERCKAAIRALPAPEGSER